MAADAPTFYNQIIMVLDTQENLVTGFHEWWFSVQNFENMSSCFLRYV